MKYSRLVIRYLLVLATLGLTGLVNAEQQIYNINLPAQTVAQSLNALSQQTDIPVLFPYKLAEVQTANPIAGRYTLQQAVAIVLSGTGLSGGLSDKGVLMISHAESDTKNQGREAMKGNRKQLLATFIAVFGLGRLVLVLWRRMGMMLRQIRGSWMRLLLRRRRVNRACRMCRFLSMSLQEIF